MVPPQMALSSATENAPLPRVMSFDDEDEDDSDDDIPPSMLNLSAKRRETASARNQDDDDENPRPPSLPVISQLDSDDQQAQNPLLHQQVDSPTARKWSAEELEKRGECGPIVVVVDVVVVVIAPYIRLT
jgi:hypothetical protein